MNIFDDMLKNILINNKELVDKLIERDDVKRYYMTGNEMTHESYKRQFLNPVHCIFVLSEEQVIDSVVLNTVLNKNSNICDNTNNIQIKEKDFVKKFMKRNFSILLNIGLHPLKMMKYVKITSMLHNAAKYDSLSNGEWNIPYKGKSEDGKFKYNYSGAKRMKNYILYQKLHQLVKLDMLETVLELIGITSVERLQFDIVLGKVYGRILLNIVLYIALLTEIIKNTFLFTGISFLNVLASLIYLCGNKDMFLRYFCPRLANLNICILNK